VQESGSRNPDYGADKFGFRDLSAVHWNHTAPFLYEHAISRGEATIVQGGALCAYTGAHTGRSPRDKHVVVDSLTEKSVWWDGNRKITPAHFQRLYDDFIAHAPARRCTRRISMAAPIPITAFARGYSPSWPGTLYLSGSC